MFGFGSKPDSHKKQKVVDEKVNKINKAIQNKVLLESLDDNIEALKKLFVFDDTLIFRNIKNENNEELKFCLVYTDGLVNSLIINQDIIKPLLQSTIELDEGNLVGNLMDKFILIGEAKKTNNIAEIIDNVTYGDTILLIDGYNEALILNTKAFQLRSIAEPEGEKILSGPREGFNEALLMNLSLIRRKVRTNELKFRYYTFGKRTNTKACVCYIDSLVNNEILDELYHRLDKIDMDGVLDANYLTEQIRDVKHTPFRTTGYTERPDIVVAKLLEGRIAVFIDGTPVVLTVPYLFIENFQSNEDYYFNYFYTSYSRLLRVISFLITVTVPSIYISIGAFHHEMFPTALIISIATERKNVPLPAGVEAFLLIIVFDILRETGVRMPTNIGQALSIVGALVIGQAAVEAKLIAAPMIIIVAITGISSLVIPKMNASIIFTRFFLLILSCTFGFFGFTLGVCCILIHILNMRSFGIPILTSMNSFNPQNYKDLFIRAPWWMMIKRPDIVATDKVRMKAPKGDYNE